MSKRSKNTCRPKADFLDRPQLDVVTAADLADLFRVLGTESRLRILHALVRMTEAGVTDLAKQLEMTPQAVSNQLQKMNSQGLLKSRRDGNSVYYAIDNPCLPVLLERGWCLLEESTFT